LRFGLKVNPRGWDDAAQWATIAEEAGFDSLWTGDNLRHPRDPTVPVHDGPAMLAAWAATTTRIKVGLLVANMIFRQPTVLAKQAVTLDHISAGRFELGIGSGLWPTDHGMSGTPVWSARERADRLSEFVGTVDRLLRGDVSDHSGAHYAPGPAPTPWPGSQTATGRSASTRSSASDPRRPSVPYSTRSLDG
jgi:alkanesulfonate monooxygenase SsuD/methylene tetrahydromethanopterin reductase-like flavin-dependent oxidoreductase (luciferase family)